MCKHVQHAHVHVHVHVHVAHVHVHVPACGLRAHNTARGAARSPRADALRPAWGRGGTLA